MKDPTMTAPPERRLSVRPASWVALAIASLLVSFCRTGSPPGTADGVGGAHTSLANWQPQIETRTINSTTTRLAALPDGRPSYALDVSVGPIHYKNDLDDPDEPWKDIDTNIKPGNQSDYQFQNQENFFKSYFRERSNAEDLVKYESGDSFITYTLKDNELGPLRETIGHPEANKFIYPHAYPGVDVQYSVSSERLLEEFVLHAYRPVERLSQQIRFEGAYFEARDDGSYQFFDAHTDEEIWTIARPVMYELGNPDTRSYGLHYEISCTETTTCMLVKVLNDDGKAWLADEARNFPLVIDATVDRDIAAGSDDYGKFYGLNGTQVMFGGVSGYSANYGQGFRFTNITIPKGSTVTSAYLSIVDDAGSWIGVSVRLTAIDEDNTPTFSGGNLPGSRPITSAHIAAQTPNINRIAGERVSYPTTGGLQQTFGAAINAVTSRPGWSSGNALAVVNNSDQDPGAVSSFGRTEYRSFDYGSPAVNGPKLHIVYTPANYRSIGDPGSYSTGTVTTNGTSIVTGTGTNWVAANRGRGDLIAINGTPYTVLSVDTPTQLEVSGFVPPFSGGYSISRMFTTLAAWEDCIDGPPGGGCPAGSPPATTSSLVTDNRSEVGIAYKDSVFSNSVSITGATTSSTNSITLTADGINRHYGLPGTGVVLDIGAGGPALSVGVDYVTVEWIEITNVTSLYGILVNGLPGGPSSQVVLRNNLIHDVSGTGVEIQQNDIKVDLINNIEYDCQVGFAITAGNFQAGSRYRILNNTIYGNTAEGFHKDPGVSVTPSLLLQNNISIGNSGNAFDCDPADSLDPASSNNVSVDPTCITCSPAGGGLQTSVASMSFVNAAAGDLHINAGSAAADIAADLSSTFNTDIDGISRQTPWDVGADEVAATTNHRSIGAYSTGDASIAAATTTVSFAGSASLPADVQPGDQLTVNPGGGNEETLTIASRDSATQVTVAGPAASTHVSEPYLLFWRYTTGDATVALGSTTVTFGSGASLPAKTGMGDRLVIGAETFHVLARDSATQVTVDQPAASAHTAAAYTLQRAYQTLQNWEDDRQGDLVAENRREVGVTYNDGPFDPPFETANSAVAINGSTTDATHYMRLTAAAGNRHNGVASAGVVIDGRGMTKFGIQDLDNFSQADSLELKGFYTAGPDSGSATVVTVGTNALYQNLLIHDFLDPDAGDAAYGVRVSSTAGPWSLTLRNSIFYNGDSAAIRISEASSSITAENCTIFGMEEYGVSLGPAGGTATVTNTISMNNGTRDFDAVAGTLTQSNNISSDGTAAGTSPFTLRTATDVPTAAPNSVVFANLTPGNEDLRLQTSTVNDAVDNGTDLSGTFCCDINSGARVSPWDIGADDLAATTRVKLSTFEASPLDAAVEVEWTTSSELNNLGFHVYRSRKEDGPYERITAKAIPGLGSSPEGAHYRYVDSGLVNGVTYYYELEDIETTGAIERHGPVSATPNAGASPGGEDRGDFIEERATSLITYGDPSASSLRVLKRDRRSVVLELVTDGFYAEPLKDGSVRLEVPGFEHVADASGAGVPVKRTWVDALAGRKVQIVSVQALGVVAFASLRPSDAEGAEVVASPDGTVRLRGGFGRRVRATRRRERDAFEHEGMSPSSAARVLSVGFQGEDKKALVELAPLRWDPASGQLLLARRLVIRLSFAEREPMERSSDGVRGRRSPTRRSHNRQTVIARFVTTERGLHAVRYEDVLRARGRVAASSLRLSRHGETVAYHLEPASAEASAGQARVFEPGSVLYFLSEGARANPFGVEAVYELEVGAPGVEMASLSAAPSGEPQPVYWHHAEWEQNRYYQAALVDAPDLWLWDVLFAPEVKSYPIEVSSLASSNESAKLGVWLQGVSDFPAQPDHHVRVWVNERLMAEVSWDGKQAKHLEVELAPDVLRDGDNVLELENVGDTDAPYSMVMLDRYDLEYTRLAQPVSGRLEGVWGQSGTAELSSFMDGAHVLDRSEAQPRWLAGIETGAGGTVRFHVDSGGSYLAVSPEAVHKPVVTIPVASRLKNTRNRADYLLIAPEAFLAAASPLLELRRSEGLEVQAVAVEDIYSEFGFGEPTPEAIKDFLSYAYHEWRQPSPRYVLLLGDATYDFKDYLRTGVQNQVPPRMVKTSYLWTASDPSYAAVNGDDPLPDLAVGRLPAATVEQVQAMVDKIVTYEKGEAGLHQGAVVLVADNPDHAGDFEADANALATGVLASENPETLFSSQLGSTATRNEILRSFDDGASLVSYIGHGGIHLWADENFFNTNDATSLAPQSQQPLLITMNCLNGYFHFPYFNSLAEELVKARDKGAIAAFSPSGLSLNEPAQRFHEALLIELYGKHRGKHRRLGDAVMAAQSAYSQTTAMPELLSIYHLFGDPALTLR